MKAFWYLVKASLIPCSLLFAVMMSWQEALAAESADTQSPESVDDIFAAYGNHGGVKVTPFYDAGGLVRLVVHFGDFNTEEQYDCDLVQPAVVQTISHGGSPQSVARAGSADPAFVDLMTRLRDLVLYAEAPERYLWLPYFGKGALNPKLAPVVDRLTAILAAAGVALSACELYDDAGFAHAALTSTGGLSPEDLRGLLHNVRGAWVRDGYKLVLLDKPAFVTDGARMATLDPLLDPGTRSGQGVAYDLAASGPAAPVVSFVCMKKI